MMPPPPVSPPIPILLWCPECMERHYDVGEFTTKPHHTHACQSCGFVWRPAITATVGVRFLPGFKNEEPPQPPDQERVEPDTLCHYQFITTSLSARIVGRCGVLRSKHGAVKDHEFVAESPAAEPSEPELCGCGHREDPEHIETLGGRPYCAKCGFYMHRFSVDRPLTPTAPIVCRGCQTAINGAGCTCDPLVAAVYSNFQATAPVECQLGIRYGQSPDWCRTHDLSVWSCIRDLRAKLAEAERSVSIARSNERETLREFVIIRDAFAKMPKAPRPVGPEVREKVAIQVLRTARELTENGAVESWRTLGSYWRNHWLMKADRIIAILAGEQEGRS